MAYKYSINITTNVSVLGLSKLASTLKMANKQAKALKKNLEALNNLKMPSVEKVARDLAKSSGSSASWRRTMKDQLSMVREMERIETRQQKMLDKTMNLHKKRVNLPYGDTTSSYTPRRYNRSSGGYSNDSILTRDRQKFGKNSKTYSAGTQLSQMREKHGNLADMFGMGFGLLGMSSLKQYAYDTPIKAEVNSYMLDQMENNSDIKKGTIKASVDTATNKLPISMQSVVQPLNAFKSATGASAEEINSIVPQFTNFGAVVQNLTGSSELAETAMQKLSYGFQGSFAALDQFGVTEESLKQAGWDAKDENDQKDVTKYMNAVTKVVGDASGSMNTFNGQMQTLSKTMSIAGKGIWQGGLGSLLGSVTTGLNSVLSAGDHFGAKLALLATTVLESVMVIGGGIGYLTQSVSTINSTFQSMKSIKKYGWKAMLGEMSDDDVGLVDSLFDSAKGTDVNLRTGRPLAERKQDIENSQLGRGTKNGLLRQIELDDKLIQLNTPDLTPDIQARTRRYKTMGYDVNNAKIQTQIAEEVTRQKRLEMASLSKREKLLLGWDKTIGKGNKEFRKSIKTPLSSGTYSKSRQSGSGRLRSFYNAMGRSNWSLDKAGAKSGLSSIKSGIGSFAGVLNGLLPSLNPVTLALGAFTVAIAGLAAVFNFAYNNSDKLRQTTAKIGSTFSKIATQTGMLLGDMFNSAGWTDKSGLDGVIDVVNKCAETLLSILETVSQVVQVLSGKDPEGEAGYKKKDEAYQKALRENNYDENNPTVANAKQQRDWYTKYGVIGADGKRHGYYIDKARAAGMSEEEIEENARLPNGGKRLVSYTGTEILKEQTGEWAASKLIENEQNVKDDKGNIKWNTGGVSDLGGPAFLLNNIFQSLGAIGDPAKFGISAMHKLGLFGNSSKDSSQNKNNSNTNALNSLATLSNDSNSQLGKINNTLTNTGTNIETGNKEAKDNANTIANSNNGITLKVGAALDKALNNQTSTPTTTQATTPTITTKDTTSTTPATTSPIQAGIPNIDLSGAKSVLDDSIKSVSDVFTNGKPNLESGLNSLIDTLTNILPGGKLLKDGWNWLTGNNGQQGGQTNGGQPAQTQATSGNVTVNGQNPTAYNNSVWSSILGSTASNVALNNSTIMTGTNQAVGQIPTSINANAPMAMAAGTNVGNSASMGLNTGMIGMQQTASSKAATIPPAVSAHNGSMNSAGNGLATNANNGFIGAFGGGISGAIQSELGGALSIMQGFVSQFQAAAAQIGSAIASAFSGPSGVGKRSPGKVYRSLRDELKITHGLFSEFMSPFKSSSALLGKEIVNTFKKGENNQYESYVDETLGLMNGLYNSMASAPRKVNIPTTNLNSTIANSPTSKVASQGTYYEKASNTTSSDTPVTTQSSNKHTIVNNNFHIDKIDSKERVQEVAESIAKVLMFNNETHGRKTPDPFGV